MKINQLETMELINALTDQRICNLSFLHPKARVRNVHAFGNQTKTSNKQKIRKKTVAVMCLKHEYLAEFKNSIFVVNT